MLTTRQILLRNEHIMGELAKYSPFCQYSQILIEQCRDSYRICRAQYSVKMGEPLLKSKKKLLIFLCILSLHQFSYVLFAI